MVREHAINRPATQALRQRLLADAEASGPLSKDLALAAILDPPIVSRVAKLLLACCPPTIAGRVALAVIAPIQAVFGGWARFHVSKEVLERPPARTDTNAAGSIVSVLGIPWIRRALPHARPGGVFRATRVIAPRVPVFVARNNPPAAAALGVACAQPAAHHDRLSPAITVAQPFGQTRVRLGEMAFTDNKTPEASAHQIDEFHSGKSTNPSLAWQPERITP